ncbi:hypothetical protein H9Q10_09495 [Eikenella sp. S3360]|uniref:Lipoprotein n=1 Tax=Eikenella glucosivorans TaxID=2766967 RepID=A0ABS0NC83_9NEIS|nr:hypothetical protein [Eikenella glucosivorans]MBH5329898.1 hypothetical protein [Eikenella glucosivorans]
MMKPYYLLLSLLLLGACRKGEPPVVNHEITLPEAVQGQGYYAEADLPFSHLQERWTVPVNSGFTLAVLDSGGGTRIALSHSGAQPYRELGETLEVDGSTGGGSLYEHHHAALYVKVHRADDPKLQQCTPLRPKPGVLMYDCSELNRRLEQARQDGTLCEKYPEECTLKVD